MSTRNHMMNFSAKALTMGLLLASSSAFAQEVAPTAPAAPAAPPPVEATVQPVTPPPVVRTLPNENDRVAPQAAAEVAAERTERATEARQSATPVRRPTVARAAPVAAPERSPSTDAVAPDAPAVADISAITDIAPVAPIEEPVVEVAQADIAPVNDAADNEWLIGAGIAGALGLAGIALLATRRRRRRSGDVVTEAAPVAPVTYAEPLRDIARPVEQPLMQPPAAAPVFAATTADPLFSRPRHDIPVAPVTRDASNLPGVTDPLFAHKPVQTPVTDPMFMRTVAMPPITDPMFAKHPEYEGGAAARTGNTDWNNSSSGANERTRELEPAE